MREAEARKTGLSFLTFCTSRSLAFFFFKKDKNTAFITKNENAVGPFPLVLGPGSVAWAKKGKVGRKSGVCCLGEPQGQAGRGHLQLLSQERGAW